MDAVDWCEKHGQTHLLREMQERYPSFVGWLDLFYPPMVAKLETLLDERVAVNVTIQLHARTPELAEALAEALLRQPCSIDTLELWLLEDQTVPNAVSEAIAGNQSLKGLKLIGETAN